ncbi:MAG: alpha/beta hydrolase family protein [Acidimicrobiia bacterium]
MADARVEAAIANWAPRFVAQGVDYNDFIRTTAGIERWEDWLAAWSATGDLHATLAAEAERAGRSLTAGKAHVRAALCYHFAKFVWMVDMDRYREAAGQAVASLYAAHHHLDPTAERVEMILDGATMVGNLRRSDRGTRPPLVVLVPGLDSTKEEFFNWENVFLERGMATFSLDGPGQGETGFATHIRPDYEVAVATALDALGGRSDLDPERVGVAGVSLGGYYAPRAAAFEPRLRAAVAIGGPFDFGECWDRLPSITRDTFIHHSGSRDQRQGAGRASELSLAGVAERIRQPLLVVFGKQDRLIPWQQAERLAAEAPSAELVMYPEGSHVCNNIPYKYRPLVADWLAERLSDRSP